MEKPERKLNNIHSPRQTSGSPTHVVETATKEETNTIMYLNSLNSYSHGT